MSAITVMLLFCSTAVPLPRVPLPQIPYILGLPYACVPCRVRRRSRLCRQMMYTFVFYNIRSLSQLANHSYLSAVADNACVYEKRPRVSNRTEGISSFSTPITLPIISATIYDRDAATVYDDSERLHSITKIFS